MLFSTVQFFIAAILAVICARVIGHSDGDIPLLAVLIPVLWFIPRRSFSTVTFLLASAVYGLTLPYQSITLSVSLWVLFPLLMVVFSHRSNLGVMVTIGLIVSALLVGIMTTQAAGRLEGSAWVTVIQTLAISTVWWSIRYWQPTKQHSWWALLLIVPLWIAQLGYAVLFALSVVGIMAAMESLAKLKNFRWSKLLCWTLPSVGFAALVLAPSVEVPNPVFVVWLCLLGTAWIADYILQSVEHHEEI
ncbi:hypothetical protein [Vibrio sp. LaRot3]|uniref:hypothetical protein n=1 Tax=Vibrio sp. LaRot3 TaxID=2998829 RepID=UPI0022CDD974|nr:hypothetical protein [Vibrio sp. LaRot3]MDA0147894.1 hypothetical protein [Vibrio sp. LaRot3]